MCQGKRLETDEVEHKPPTHTDILVLGTPITTRLPKINPRITAARAAPKSISIQWLPLHHLTASTDSVERFNQSGQVLNLFKPAQRPKMDREESTATPVCLIGVGYQLGVMHCYYDMLWRASFFDPINISTLRYTHP